MGNFFKSFWWLILAFLFGIIGLGFYTEQSDFNKILLFYSPMFLAYGWLVFFRKKELQTNCFFGLIGLAIFLRFILLFAFPFLSDDVFRFIWDGRLWQQGINPFNHLPTHFLEVENAVEGLDISLFQQLNSPDYFTIYPPVNQLVFYVSTWLFPNSIWWSAFMMKVFLFASEVGTVLLLPRVLKKYKFSIENSLIYILNPLIIIEVCGNLHFEGMMVFFLLLAICLLQEKRFNTSAIAFALSIASKLLPLIFLPFFIIKIGFRKAFQYGIIVAISLAIFYAPILNETFINNFANSLNLYFQKFEFNASVYYFLRWIGYQKVGWNMIAQIGPGLAILSFITILFMALFKTKKPDLLPAKWLWAIMVYLMLTTTVHPWYVSLPLFLCCFTNFRFPVVWSFLICLTYVNYSYEDYFENLWVVGLEYFVVFGFMIWEIRNNRNLSLRFN